MKYTMGILVTLLCVSVLTVHTPQPPDVTPAKPTLHWPIAGTYQQTAVPATEFAVPESNYVLDFHGSVHNPDLVIFMAGNQYRVMPDLLSAFQQWVQTQPAWQQLRFQNIFYATLPPGTLLQAMQTGRLQMGNLWFDIGPEQLWPDVFMAGPRQQKRLHELGWIESYSLYARNRGVVLLTRAGNPKAITSVHDLLRDDVRVAFSSPTREPDSFESYAKVLRSQGGDDLPDKVLAKASTLSPQFVHHRENVQLLAEGRVDTAPMYYHFGDYLKTTFPALFDYVVLPQQGNSGNPLAIAQLKAAQRPQQAEAWLAFVRSEAAKAVFERHGFTYASAPERLAMVIPQ